MTFNWKVCVPAVVTKLGKMTGVPAPVAVDGDANTPYYRPLGSDGEPKNFLKTKTQTDRSKCTGCGVCAALCPMGSISREDPAEVTGVCIKCHSCVRNCPTGAKYFDDEAFLSHKAMLERDYTRRADAKIFLYDKLTKEQFVSLIEVLKLSKYLKSPINQRGKARPQLAHGKGKKKRR